MITKIEENICDDLRHTGNTRKRNQLVLAFNTLEVTHIHKMKRSSRSPESEIMTRASLQEFEVPLDNSSNDNYTVHIQMSGEADSLTLLQEGSTLLLLPFSSFGDRTLSSSVSLLHYQVVIALQKPPHPTS